MVFRKTINGFQIKPLHHKDKQNISQFKYTPIHETSITKIIPSRKNSSQRFGCSFKIRIRILLK